MNNWYNFDSLKKSFLRLIDESNDKAGLLAYEKDKMQKIFSRDLFELPCGELQDWCPFKEWLIHYHYLNLIKEYYFKYILYNRPFQREMTTEEADTDLYQELEPTPQMIDVLEQTKDLLNYRDWLETFKLPLNEPIVNRIILDALFNKYGKLFEGETAETFANRFINDGKQREPIKVEKNAKGEDEIHKYPKPINNKTILLAILKAIQPKTNQAFIFDEFVENNFGLKDFTKAASYHRNKFRSEKEIIDTIIDNMTP